jgi:hypothetical protein
VALWSGAVHTVAAGAAARDLAPFPASPHQSGHEVLPHPAFRDPSSRRYRRCRVPRDGSRHSAWNRRMPLAFAARYSALWSCRAVSMVWLALSAFTSPYPLWTHGPSAAPSLRRAYVVSASTVLWAAPTPAPLSPTSRSPAYRVRRSQSTSRLAPRRSHRWGGDGSLLFPS